MGIKEDPALIQQVPLSLEGAEKAIAHLISRSIPFDAIVTSEDILAVGAQRAALENGRYVPVVGWNNSILAACATPTLSSIDNRLDSLCASAVQSMIQLLSRQDQPSLSARNSVLSSLNGKAFKQKGVKHAASDMSHSQFLLYCEAAAK